MPEAATEGPERGAPRAPTTQQVSANEQALAPDEPPAAQLARDRVEALARARERAARAKQALELAQRAALAAELEEGRLAAELADLPGAVAEPPAPEDLAAVEPLLDDRPEVQALAAGASQVYRYAIPFNGSTALLFSLVKSEGEADFEVSASREFPEDPAVTTRMAEEVALLPASGPLVQRALEEAVALGREPELFVRVRASGASTCRFTLSAKASREAGTLRNGDVTEVAVEPLGYERYRFLPDGASEEHPVSITIKVTPTLGRPEVYVGFEPNQHPHRHLNDGGQALGVEGGSVEVVATRPGWVYLGTTSATQAAFSLQVLWGEDEGKFPGYTLDDGVEQSGRLEPGGARLFLLELGAAAAGSGRGEPAAVRLEVSAGAADLCLLGDASAAAAALEDAAQGAWERTTQRCQRCAQASAAAADARAAPGLRLAGLDVPGAELARLGARAALLVRSPPAGAAEGGEAEFYLRAQVHAPVRLEEGHSVVLDSLAAPEAGLAPEGGALLARHYLHYAQRPGAGVELELRPLGADAGCRGSRLLARWKGTRDADADDPEWPFASAPAGADGVPAGPLLLRAAGARVEGERPPGAWLEVRVEAPGPLAFALSFGEGGAGGARAPTRLLPGAAARGRLSEDGPTAADYELGGFSFASRGAPEEAAGAGWRLRLSECYGKVRGRLSYDCPARPEWPTIVEGGSEVTLPGPLAVGGCSSGMLSVEPGAALPVAYEVELLPPGGGGAEWIRLPDAPSLDLVPVAGPLTYRFAASTRGLAAGQGAERALTYELVAVRQDDGSLRPNSTCGLLEALRRGAAVAAEPEGHAAPWQGEVRASLPPELVEPLRGQNVSVNVLVRLVENGSQLAARSYAAASLGTEAWAQVGEPRFHSTGLFAATALLLSGFALSRGACSRAGRLCGLAGATGGSDGGDVELDVHWDLADYEMDPGGSGVSPPQGRSRYVPPSV